MLRWLSQAFWITIFLCALVGFGALVLNASRNPPTHQQSERSRKTQDGPQFVPPIAGEAPLNENHPEQTDGARREEKRKPSESTRDWLGRFVEFNITDLLLALFTGVLAWKTGGLFRETAALRAAANQQARDMEASIIEARRSADAANLNAEALINSERAHLFVVVTNHNVHEVLMGARFYESARSMQDSQLSPRPALSFVIKNTGRTAAILTEISYQLIQANSDQTGWEYTLADTIVQPVIEGGKETTSTPCEQESILLLRDGVDAVNETRPLYFYGCVAFRTVFKREYRYFWRYQYSGRRFVLVHEEEHQTKQ
jgi:hypothetical protein